MARGYPDIDLPVGREPTDNIWEAMFTQHPLHELYGVELARDGLSLDVDD